MGKYLHFAAFVAIAAIISILVTPAQAQSGSYTIYFESDRDGDIEIYCLDGDDAVAVTSGGCKHPTVTSDGSMLAYTRIEETLWGRFWNVFYLKDGEEHKLSANEIYVELEPVISRDGMFAAYTTMRAGNLEIITLPLDQNDLQYRITESEKPDEFPALSAGDDWVYWTGRTGVYSYIFRAPGRGGQPERISENPDAWDEHPSISADGRYMAYVSITRDEGTEEDEDEEIDEDEDEDAEEESISRSNEPDCDGGRICSQPYDSSHGSTTGLPGLILYPQYATGGVPTIDEGEEDEQEIEGGDELEDERTEQDEGNLDIWVLDLVTDERTRLTFDPAWDGNPSISADGEKIVFTSDRDGNYEIYMINRDGTGLTRLTDNEATDDFAVIT